MRTQPSVTATAILLLLHSRENSSDESSHSVSDDVSDEVVDDVSDDSGVRRTAVQHQRRRRWTRTIYLVSKYKGCVKKEGKKRKGEIGKQRFFKYPSGWQQRNVRL